MTIREDTKGRILLTGLQQVPINSIEDLLKALNFGSTIRQTDATTINAKSSRSHAVFSLNLVQKKAKDSQARTKRMSMPVDASFAEESITVDSKLHFIDLAGSERLKNTGASGERAKEGISINAGLASLGKVISQLSARHATGHVSYRDSKLTRLLQDSLGGNAVTYLVACVNPAEFHLSETLNTIQYAQRARNIQSKPKIQQVSDESNKQALIERLRAEISYLREQLRLAQGRDKESTEHKAKASEASTEKEIELQNQLLDSQESLKALKQRHVKLISEISKAQDGSTEDLPVLKSSVGDSAMERIQRSESLSDAVEQVVLEYEKTIESYENHLNAVRASLATAESELLERETKFTYLESLVERLQSRLQTAQDRETSTEQYVRELESNIEGKTNGEEENAATITELRNEINRLRAKDNNAEEYIASLEDNLQARNQEMSQWQRETSRLERVIERQRCVARLDDLLIERNQNPSTSDPAESQLPPLEVPGDVGHVEAGAGALSDATYHLAVKTPLPETVEENENEEDQDAASTPARLAAPAPGIEATMSPTTAEQSHFMEEKLDTVNQELFDLRVEHESTVNDLAQLTAKYEQAMRDLTATKAPKVEEETSRPTDLKSGARMKTRPKGSGQILSSRSLSLELSSAGERPGSQDLSEASVQSPVTPSGDSSSRYSETSNEEAAPVKLSGINDGNTNHVDLEELKQLAADKDAALRELQARYEDLSNQLTDNQDQIEELKAEVTKAKMNNPPSPTNQFLRRKSSWNVMSIDRAHRSLASLGNIAAENFAEEPDIKDQFELHINAIMHELHQRSERVSVLESELSSVKRDMEGKMTIISGLTRERTSMKAQSPMDMSMFTSMREQLETQANSVSEAANALERDRKKHAEATAALEEERQKQSEAIAALEEDRQKHSKALAALHQDRQSHSETLAAFEQERQKHSEAVAALDQDRQRHSEAMAALEEDRKRHIEALAALDEDREQYSEAVSSFEGEREQHKKALAALDAERQQHFETVTAFEEDREKHNEAMSSLEMRMKSEADKALVEARAKLEELEWAKEELTQELTQVREREQRASRLVEELEGQLASQFEEGQQASSRLSHMQSTRDQELAEARALNARAQEEISLLNKRLSQMDVSSLRASFPCDYANSAQTIRGSVQSASIDQAVNGDRMSSMSNTVRKTNSVQSLPSPPPAIPLPPLPGVAAGAAPTTNGDGRVSPVAQRIEEQEARIRTIEKHLFAEKQLTATLEEALTDIERDGKQVRKDLEHWKKKCWEYEEELGTLREERRSNRDSLQAIEAEKAGRLRAEKAREALEERMALLNNNKKKKKSTLNCF